MEVLGPSTTRAMENPANDALFDWIIIRGGDEEFRYYDSVISYDKKYVATMKSGSAGMDKVILKEIEEIQKQRLENIRTIDKEKIISAGRK